MSNLDAYDPVYEAAGKEWDVDPLLLKAIATQESGGNDRAVSKAGAQGRMQITPETQKYLGITDPYDPVQSIWGGAKYMAEALDKEGSPERALAYYHGGPDWAAPGMYGPESAAYVPAVTQRYLALQQAAAKTQQSAQTHPTPAGGDAKPGRAASDWEQFKRSVTGTGKPDGSGEPQPSQPAPPAGAAPPAKTWDQFKTELGATQTADAPAAPSATPTMPSGLPSDPDETGPAPAGWPTPRVPDAVKRVGGAVVEGWNTQVPDAVKRVGGAVVEGWNTPNPLMSPQLQHMIEGGSGVGNYVTSPLLQIGGWAPRGANALTAGILAAANELAGGGPLGRDVAQLLQLMPEAQRTGGLAGQPAMPAAGPRNPLTTVDRPYLTPEASADIAASRPSLLAAHANETSPTGTPTFTGGPALSVRPEAAPQATVPIQLGDKTVAIPARPEADAAGPRGVGAQATPGGQSEMTMAEYKANRKQGELNAIMEPAKASEDNTVYVQTQSGKTSTPTLAERSGDAETSQRERLLRESDPNAFAPVLRAANEARVEQFAEDMGSAPAREAINRDLQDLARKEQPLVLRNAKPLDLSHTQEALNGILNDPRQSEIEAVRKVIAPLRDALLDAKGKPKRDALSGWGMIDNIRNKIDQGGLETSMERHVVGQLLEVKKALTQDMDASTGGRFSQYLGKQNELLQKRNAMDVLQNFWPQLTNAKGDIQFANYHRWLLGLAKKRGAPGTDPAMAIPDSTMLKLIAIDKDLKRAQNIDLGSSRGSHTHLMFALSKSMGLGLVHAAVHGGVAAMGGGVVGNLMAQRALSTGATKINALNLRRQVRRHLAEPPPGENWLAH